jgi:hypothetical protein
MPLPPYPWARSEVITRPQKPTRVDDSPPPLPPPPLVVGPSASEWAGPLNYTPRHKTYFFFYCWSHGLLRCIQKLGVLEHSADILQDDQTTGTLNKIDIGDIARGISKIIDIEWHTRSTMNPRNLGDNYGGGINPRSSRIYRCFAMVVDGRMVEES